MKVVVVVAVAVVIYYHHITMKKKWFNKVSCFMHNVIHTTWCVNAISVWFIVRAACIELMRTLKKS